MQQNGLAFAYVCTSSQSQHQVQSRLLLDIVVLYFEFERRLLNFLEVACWYVGSSLNHNSIQYRPRMNGIALIMFAFARQNPMEDLPIATESP